MKATTSALIKTIVHIIGRGKGKEMSETAKPTCKHGNIRCEECMTDYSRWHEWATPSAPPSTPAAPAMPEQDERPYTFPTGELPAQPPAGDAQLREALTMLRESLEACSTDGQLAWWHKWAKKEPPCTSQMALTLFTRDQALKLLAALAHQTSVVGEPPAPMTERERFCRFHGLDDSEGEQPDTIRSMGGCTCHVSPEAHAAGQGEPLARESWKEKLRLYDEWPEAGCPECDSHEFISAGPTQLTCYRCLLVAHNDWLEQLLSQQAKELEVAWRDTARLDWIEADWPLIRLETSHEHGSVEIARLEPGQGAHYMFDGTSLRDALDKAMTAPPTKRGNVKEWRTLEARAESAEGILRRFHGILSLGQMELHMDVGLFGQWNALCRDLDAFVAALPPEEAK